MIYAITFNQSTIYTSLCIKSLLLFIVDSFHSLSTRLGVTQNHAVGNQEGTVDLL